MVSTTRHFNVGDLQCIAVKDGTFSYPTGWFFSNVSQEQLEGSLRDHDLPLNQVVIYGIDHTAFQCECLASQPHYEKRRA